MSFKMTAAALATIPAMTFANGALLDTPQNAIAKTASAISKNITTNKGGTLLDTPQAAVGNLVGKLTTGQAEKKKQKSQLQKDFDKVKATPGTYLYKKAHPDNNTSSSLSTGVETAKYASSCDNNGCDSGYGLPTNSGEYNTWRSFNPKEDDNSTNDGNKTKKMNFPVGSIQDKAYNV